MHKKNKIKKSEGFTFVETLCVLAIGAVLTAGACVSGVKVIDMAKRISAKNSIRNYSSALQSYFIDCGQYPTEQQGLEALWAKPVLYPVPENWNGPYVEQKIKCDPWNYSYVYLRSESALFPEDVSSKLSFVIMSYGQDGKRGGDGKNEDICSWK